MKWKWEDLSFTEHKTLKGKCTVLLREGTVFDLSSLLNGFQLMECRWNEDESMKQAIFAGIVKNLGQDRAIPMDGQGVANVIYYLGQSEIEWKDLPNDLQNSLFNGISQCYISFNEQEISNTIHG
jgi:hypothetical protein